MNNLRMKYWPVFFLAIFVEGIFSLAWLALIPPDAKNNILLGFSIRRLLMLAAIIAIMASSLLGGLYSWRKRNWRERWLDPNRIPVFFRWLDTDAG